YLSIGRHLAEKGVAPPNAPQLLAQAHRRREAVDQHLQHRAELSTLSSQIDKQELRKFYFSVFSVLVLLALTLLVVFQSPRGREWLPQETDTIMSINTDQFERANLAKRWPNDQPKLLPGLIGAAASVPGLKLSRDAVHELVQVRLGTKPDLKITGQLFDRFQALDRDSALRIISRDPPDLSRVFHPIFNSELLNASQLLGLAVNLQTPVKARVLIRVNSTKNSADLARNLH